LTAEPQKIKLQKPMSEGFQHRFFDISGQKGFAKSGTLSSRSEQFSADFHRK